MQECGLGGPITMNDIVARRIDMLEELIRNHPDSKTSKPERELLEELKEQQKPKREI